MGRKFSEMKQGFWLVKAEVGTGLLGTSWKRCGCSHFRCWQKLSGETLRGGGWERKPSKSPGAWLQEHSSDSTKTTDNEIICVYFVSSLILLLLGGKKEFELEGFIVKSSVHKESSSSSTFHFLFWCWRVIWCSIQFWTFLLMHQYMG